MTEHNPKLHHYWLKELNEVVSENGWDVDDPLDHALVQELFAKETRENPVDAAYKLEVLAPVCRRLLWAEPCSDEERQALEELGMVMAVVVDADATAAEAGASRGVYGWGYRVGLWFYRWLLGLG